MADKEIVEYIKKNLNRGVSSQRIHQGLLAQGKSDYDINQAFKEIESKKDSKEDLVHEGEKEKSFMESKKFRIGLGIGILIILSVIIYIFVSS